MLSLMVPGEEERLLGHDAELAAQRGERHVREVVPVDQHPARGRVVEARDQLGHRRLARPRGAHEGHRLAGRNREVDVVQHRHGRVVAERDVVEADLAADLRQLDRVGRLEHRRLGLEQAAQLEHRRPALLEGVVLLHEQLDRREEPVHVEEERGQLAEVDLLRVVQVHGPADAQDEHLAEDADHLRPRAVDAVDPARVVVGVPVGADDVAVGLDVVALPVVRGDDAHALQALGEVGQHRARCRRAPCRSRARRPA